MLKKITKKIFPYMIAGASILGIGTAQTAQNVQNTCVANYGTIKNPTITQLEEIYKLDGRKELGKIVEEKYPNTVSINLEGNQSYNLEELLGKKYIVSYGRNEGPEAKIYVEGNNYTLLNPNAQKIKVVEGTIDTKEKAKAIASLLNYCRPTQNLNTTITNEFNKFTNEIEKIITQYYNKTQEEINNLKISVENNGDLLLHINNQITYGLGKIDEIDKKTTDLESRVTKVEDIITEKRQKERKENTFSVILDLAGVYGTNSSFNSDSFSGLGYRIGGEGKINLGNFVITGGINYSTHELNSEEQKENTSTTTLEGTIGYIFGDEKDKFTISAGVFDDIVKQRIKKNDSSGRLEGSVYGLVLEINYETDFFGAEAYIGKSLLSGQAHQNLIILGKPVNSNGMLDVLKAGGKVKLPVYKNGSFQGSVVLGLDYRDRTVKSEESSLGHEVKQKVFYVTGGLQFKF